MFWECQLLRRGLGRGLIVATAARATGAAHATGAALIATASAGAAIRSTLATTAAATALTTALRRAHLFELGHLLGREDFFQLGLRFQFERGQVFFLLRRQVQRFFGARGQQMKAALAAFAAGSAHASRTTLTAIRARGAVAGGRSAALILGHYRHRGHAECQRQ